MAIASGGTLGTGAHATSNSSFTFNTATNTLAAGQYGLLVVVTDNISTTDGDTNTHTNVSGGTGTWVKVWEHTNANGAAAAGVTVSIWRFQATGNVPTGTTITITLSAAAVDKTCSFWKFTVADGALLDIDIEPSTHPVTNDLDASSGFGSVSFSGLTSRERLYFRGLAKEANSTTQITASSGFTAITGQRSRNNSNAVIVRGEFRINTSTGETSNPTLSVTGDTAGIFCAFVETRPTGPVGPIVRRRRVLWPGRAPAGAPLRINWSHPLARGLVSAWVCQEGAGATADLVRPASRAAPALETAGPGWGSSAQGIMLLRTAHAGDRPDLEFTTAFTVSACMIRTSLTNITAAPIVRLHYVADDDCGGYGLDWWPESTDGGGGPSFGVMLVHRNNNSDYWNMSACPGSTGSPPNVWSVGVMSRASGSFVPGRRARVYVDGTLRRERLAHLGTSIRYTGSEPCYVLLQEGKSGSYGGVQWVYIHNRELAPSEVAWLHADPYAFLELDGGRFTRYRGVVQTAIRDLLRAGGVIPYRR